MPYVSSNPKQPFYVANQCHLNENQQLVLTKLYQPIIGPAAIALYETLMGEFDHMPIASEYHTLYQLQSELDCDLKALFEALHRLEATGLLKTFTSQNPILGESLIFELQEIPQAGVFFKTFLLSSLLLEKIGEVQFKRLNQRFAPQSYPILKRATEVTSGFFEVFHLVPDEAITPPKVVQQAAATMSSNEQLVIARGKTKTIDWDFLTTLLAVYHIPASEVSKHRQKISDLMMFYHLNEQDFVNQVLLTLSAGKNDLDLKAIANVINEHSGQSQTKLQVKKQLAKAQQKDHSLDRLTHDERVFLNEIIAISPIDYLFKLKQQKHGYVAASERRIVFKLENQYGLSPQLINVLVHTCLGYDTVLTATLANKIANDWLQNGVATAAKAIVHVRHFHQKRSSYSSRQFKNKTLEKGTDWTQKQATHESKLSLNELKSLLDDRDSSSQQH